MHQQRPFESEQPARAAGVELTDADVRFFDANGYLAVRHLTSDDEIRDQARQERDEVVDVDQATAMAALDKIRKRDAELLERLAR